MNPNEPLTYSFLWTGLHPGSRIGRGGRERQIKNKNTDSWRRRLPCVKKVKRQVEVERNTWHEETVVCRLDVTWRRLMGLNVRWDEMWLLFTVWILSSDQQQESDCVSATFFLFSIPVCNNLMPTSSYVYSISDLLAPGGETHELLLFLWSTIGLEWWRLYSLLLYEINVLGDFRLHALCSM